MNRSAHLIRCLLLALVSVASAQTGIMPLGDSITHGGGDGNDSTDGSGYYYQSGYRSQLVTNLTAANVSFLMQGVHTGHATQAILAAGQASHNGYGGYTLGDIRGNLAANGGTMYNMGGFWITGGNPTNGNPASGPINRPAVHPDIVLLLGGTNDANTTSTADLTNGNGLQRIKTNLHNVLSWFNTNRPNAIVIVGLTPGWNYPGDPNAIAKDNLITQFNRWVVSTEMPLFPKYRLVDMNALFRNADGTFHSGYYSTDGVHPNFAGYEAMGNAWTTALMGLGIVPKWAGDGAGNVWSNGGPTNFRLLSGNSLPAGPTTSSVAFAPGNAVYFDDSGSNTSAVALAGSLAPAWVTVNASKNYVFGGAGILAGAMALTKSGSGTLQVATANTYTGGTTIKAGTVQIGAGGATGSLGAGTVTNSGILAFNRGDSSPFANFITGSGTVQQIGGGTTILTGSNDYSGLTTLSAGTLQIGNNGPTGSLGSGAVVNNASLVFHRSDNVTLYNPISGSGSLTKLGAGTLTLSAAETYTGATIISGGTLRLQNAPPLPTANLLYRLSAATASGYTLTGGNVTTLNDLSGNGNHFTATGTNGPTVLFGSNGINGRNVLHFSGASASNKLAQSTATSAKSLFIVNRPAATVQTSGIWGQNGGFLNGIWGQNNGDLGIRITTGTANAWQYAGGNGGDFVNGSSGSMWINGAPVSTAANGTYSATVAHLLEVTNANAGTFAAGLGSYFTGGDRAYAGDIGEVLAYDAVLSPTDRQAVEAYLNFRWFTAGGGFGVLSASTAVNLTASGGALDLNGLGQTVASLAGVPGSKVFLGGGALTISGAASPTFAGAITDAGGASSAPGGSLTKAGGGTLTLSGSNAYSGPTQITGGILLVTGTLNTAGATITVGNGATLNASGGTITAATIHVLSGGTFIANGTITGAISVDAGGSVTTNNAPSNPFTGAGTLAINTGANTFVPGSAGSFNGFAGTLNLASSGGGKLALVTSGANIGSGSTVNFAPGATLFLFSGATISGVTFNLTGTGNNEGLGAIRIENNTTLAAGSTVNLLANSTLGGNGAATIAAPITGSGFGFTKVGTGTLTLSGANSFSGSSAVAGGALKLANALALQNSTFATSSALASSGLVFSSAVAGNAFTLGGLSGNGPLVLQNDAATPAAIALSVGNNGVTSTYSGALSGPGSLVKVGAGAFVLAGPNTYAGPTTISAGTLRLKAPPVFPSGMKVMPVGDSITWGASGTNSGYRGPLYNLIKDQAPGFLFVGSSTETLTSTTVNPSPAEQLHNEGHGSYTINDINNNLDGLDSTTFNLYGPPSRDPNGGHWLDGIASGANARPPLFPTIITMMIGTNNAGDADRTAVRNQLHALITKITTMRPATRLIIAQITPSDRPNNVSYNAAVASEVAGFQAAGKLVTMVDMFTDFPGGGISGDGTHPNDTGFAFMAQQWYDGLAAVAATGKGASTSIPAGSPLTVLAGGTFDLDGAQATITRIAGAGAITLGPGGVLTATNPIGFDTTFSGPISGAGRLNKTGAGTWTLAGASTYTGATQIAAGTLRVTGSLSNDGTIEVLGGAVLELGAGAVTAGTIHVRSGGILRGSGVIHATIINDEGGTITSRAGQTLSFTGSVTNNGLLQFTGGSALAAGGAVTNGGTIDLVTGSQTLPAGLVNNGIILDASAAKTSAIAVASGNLSVTVQSYVGHGYQLQFSATLPAASWQNVGAPQMGTGGSLTFPAGSAAGGHGFYRILVNP